MNRTDRLFSIILHLQSNPKSRAEDLALRFDITKRTVYRDIAAIQEAGVPITGKAGQGYTIAEGYFLPPISFAHDEAFMLVLGAEAVGQHFDAQYKSAARSAENKIFSSFPAPLKKEIGYLKSYIKFFASAPFGSIETKEAMLKIRRAILEKKRVAFRYYKMDRSSDKPTVREVDPYALTNINGRWLMAGFDHLRKGLRMFRLNRMEAVLVTGKSFERPVNFSISQLAKEDPSIRHRFVIGIDRSIARWVFEQPPYRIIRRQKKGNRIFLTIESSNEEELLFWTLRWGHQAEAISPQDFRNKLKGILRMMSDIYR